MKKHLAVCLSVIMAFSQLFSFCALADTASAETEASLITKAKGEYYTVDTAKSATRATKFGISPNVKGTEYYIDPKQSDSEIIFGSPSSDYKKSSFSITSVNVTDNANFTSAKKFTVTNLDGFNNITNSSLNLYQGDSTAFKEWINVPYADMRFWIKTSCDFTVTLSIASSYNGKYPHIRKTITVPAGDDWQEIKITRDDFSDNDQFEKNVKENQGVFYFRMMTADNMLPENETVYISKPRFNNGALDPSVVKNVYVDYSYYYNNFQSYNILSVTNDSYYDGTYNYNDEFRLTLPAKTDLSSVTADGNMRFWVNVPRDMTMYFGLASQNSSGTYGRALCQKALKVSDSDENGFQEVEIPLSALTIKEGSFSWRDVKFVVLRGTNNCTADTFLAVGEVLKISPIEFWSGASPEPQAAYTYTPKYYNVAGNVTVVDLEAKMDSRTHINAFSHSNISDEYLQLAEAVADNTKLLKALTITSVIAGAVESDITSEEYTEYAVTRLSTDMNVLIPATKEMKDYKLTVGVVGENGFNSKTYELTDEYLIVNTNELGDFLIMGTQIPVYTASVSGNAVNDNTILASGISFVRASNTSEYQSLMAFSSSSAAAPSADVINEWLADDNAQMSIWIKAPYKKEGTVNLQLDLCLRTSSYPHKSAAITLAADGYWHELRIDASKFTGNSFDSITGNDYQTFYIRIKGNEVGDEYWIGSDIAFYKSPIDTEVNDGNILLDKVALVDTPETGKGSSVNVSVTNNTEIFDNKFYSNAMVYSVTDATNYSFDVNNVTPYKISAPTGEEFKAAVINGGDVRTYVKNVSDHEMNFILGVKTWCKGGNEQGNFLLNTSVSVPNDGKWHEVRIPFKNLNNVPEYRLNALLGVEGYSYGTIYLRIYDLNDDFKTTEDKLYITPLEIYNRSIIGKPTDDINDANVALEQIAIVDTKDGGGASNISVSEVNIADNKFYRTAVKYYNPIVGSASFSGNNTYAYKITNVTGTEFKDFIRYHGVMRTYIKNASDHNMTFTVGLKIRYVLNGQNCFKELKRTVEAPGDGKWHEYRISYESLGLSTTSNEYKALSGVEGYKLNGVWLHITGLDKADFTDSSDELYITPMEIYNRNIEVAETTDFAREYKQAMLLKKYRSDKTNTYISMASTSVSDSPFFSNAVKYTANNSYYAGYTSGQIGFVEGQNIDTEAFADWYYNAKSDLRIWVKAKKDTKFMLSMFVSGNKYAEVPSSIITVSASEDWQMITIPRSAFGSSGEIVNAIAGRKTIGVNIFFYAVNGTFAQTGDSLSIGQCVEVYSDKAYDKGDTNRDGVIGIKDLVHIKKQALEIDVNVKNCDINNSGSIEALDLTLMRKMLLNGVWN